MKIRDLLLTLVGLALSFAWPAFAQQNDTVDPQLHDALAALDRKMDAGHLSNDAAAIAALYTDDAVVVSHDLGPIYGRDAIQKHLAEVFKNIHFIKHVSQAEQNSPHLISGNEFWSTGEFDQTFQVENGPPLRIKGHYLNILVREGDVFKYKVDTYNFTGPPVPAETK